MTIQFSLVEKLLYTTQQPETKRIDRTMAKREKDDEYYKKKKVFLSLFDFFCFVNILGWFLFSILVDINDIFIE